jgi:hypothetical protein
VAALRQVAHIGILFSGLADLRHLSFLKLSPDSISRVSP